MTKRRQRTRTTTEAEVPSNRCHLERDMVIGVSNLCHLERNKIRGEADDRVQARDPTPLFLRMVRQGLPPRTETLSPASRERLVRFVVVSFDSTRPAVREDLPAFR